MKKHGLLILFLSIAFMMNAQENHLLKVHLEGKQYEKLTLKLFSGPDRYAFEGKSMDKQNWTFEYPDSVFQIHSTFGIYVMDELVDNHFLGDEQHMLRFNIPSKGADTMVVNYGCLGLNEPELSISYIETIVRADEEWGGQKILVSDFLVKAEEDTEMYAHAKAYTTSYPWNFEPDYKKQLATYIALTKKHPYSRSLMRGLWERFGNFKSKADVESVFKHFDAEQKESYFGKKVQAYISGQAFENMKLPISQTGEMEDIIQDSTKYTLVIFSTARTAVHPVRGYKKIYEDLSQNLDIAYISLDGKETLHIWDRFIVDEDFKWRCYTAGDARAKLSEKYYVRTMPLMYLVAPDGSYNRVSINSEKEFQDFHKMINN